MNDADDALLSIRATQELLGVSRASIYRLHDAGKLKFVKVGFATRVTRSSVRGLIASLENEGYTPARSPRPKNKG